MSVLMELHKIIISEMQDQQIIMLKEVDGERTFPIVIGNPEAIAIDRRLKGIPMARPMTHDLVTDMLDQLGAQAVDPHPFLDAALPIGAVALLEDALYLGKRFLTSEPARVGTNHLEHAGGDLAGGRGRR